MSRSIKELQEQKEHLEALIAQQMNMEKLMIENIDVFLALTPKHSPPYMQKKGGGKHTDEIPYAVQFCDRCLLLQVKNTKEWVEGVSVMFYINRCEEFGGEGEDPPKKKSKKPLILIEEDEDEDIEEDEEDDD